LPRRLQGIKPIPYMSLLVICWIVKSPRNNVLCRDRDMFLSNERHVDNEKEEERSVISSLWPRFYLINALTTTVVLTLDYEYVVRSMIGYSVLVG
jgi:hypothetical protein